MCYKKLKDLLCRLSTKEFWLRPPKPNIGNFFWIMFVVGIVSYLGSFGMNIRTLINYVSSGEWWYFSILLMAIVLPQVPVNLFSFWWFRNDSKNRSISWGLTILHCLLLALPLRMLRMGRLAKSTEKGVALEFHRFYLAQADLSFLRLVCVYAGSGSQLVVRIYKLLRNWNGIESAIFDIVFGILAAVSLALSTISLCRHCRSHRYDKQELSYTSTILQVLYRICFLASRVVALACLFKLGITPALIICACLFVAFLVWFHFMKTDFTENAKQERFFHVLMAYLHLFGMFNVKDNAARYRYAFYYSLSFIFEVLVFTTFYRSMNDMYWVFLFPGIFLLGIVCHGVEHWYFHPGGTLYIERELDDWELHCDDCAEEKELAAQERIKSADAV